MSALFKYRSVFCVVFVPIHKWDSFLISHKNCSCLPRPFAANSFVAVAAAEDLK